jgi:flagellar FliL protein
MPVEEEFIQSASPRQQEVVGQAPAEVKSPKRGLNSIMTLVIIVAAMMVAVASGFYVTQIVRAPKTTKPPVVVKPKPKPKPSYISLKPEFTVNLNSNGQYLETELVLKADSSKVNSELDKKMPEVRDKIISIMASQSYSNLLTQAGKQGLKAQIQAGVNSLLAKGKIIDVLYTSFIMQ